MKKINFLNLVDYDYLLKLYINGQIDTLPKPMVFKGSLGTGGTITSLPTASADTVGHTYKVITDGTYAGLAAKVGDTFICSKNTSGSTTTYSWVLIPSGDEPSGTVTSVGLSAPTGFSVSGSPVTSSGTLKLTFASGYSLPTTAKQSNWDTAYGWGNHAGLYLPLAGGTMTGAIAMGSNKITGLATPTNSADAVTKSYVDTHIVSGKLVQGGGINSLVNSPSAVGINPAINGLGYNTKIGTTLTTPEMLGAQAKVFMTRGGVEFEFVNSTGYISQDALERLFDGKQGTYILFSWPLHYLTTDNTGLGRYNYSATKAYSVGDFVRYTTASITSGGGSDYAWYRCILANTGQAPSGVVQLDNSYWEYMSAIGSNYYTGINASKLTELRVRVYLTSSTQYENGVSIYWRTASQKPKYLQIRKIKSDGTLNGQSLVLDMDGETVTSQYFNFSSSLTVDDNKIIDFVFSGFPSSMTSTWACVPTQFAFSGNVGGLEGTLVNRGGGTSSSMYGHFLPYKTNTLSLGNSTYQWNTAYIKTIYENGTSLSNKYLPLAGGKMTGAAPISFEENKSAVSFRPNNASYNNCKIEYMSSGNEALVFANKNAAVSYIFKCGYDMPDGRSSAWYSILPTLQMKEQSVYINKLIASGIDPSHNFLVSGTSRFEGSVNVTNTAANTGCTMSYDSTEECIKFTFN